MKKYLVIISVVVLFFGCGRAGSEGTNVKTFGEREVATSGEIIFEKKSKSLLVDKNGNSFIDKGHYSLLVQSKDKNDNPIGDLTNITTELFENNSNVASNESKVKIQSDGRSTKNSILLLLDFSGSLVSDCGNISIIGDNKDNLCYQLVESAKEFIKDTVHDQQAMAIYYFNSKTAITALATSNEAGPTTDKVALISKLEQLYKSEFRATNLEGFTSTNLNGAVIEATKVACHWVDSCNYDVYSPLENANTESFEFSSIVVFTDGQDLAKRTTTQEMFDFVNDHDELFYYTIGLGDVDKNVLNQLGRDSYISVDNNSDLDDAFNDLTTQLQSWGNSFYKVEYCPATQEGRVDIKIKVTSDRYFGVIDDSITLPNNIDFRCDL